MSRRQRKEDWGGEDSDDEGSLAPVAGAGGMSKLLGRGKLSKAALAASAGRRSGDGDAGDGDAKGGVSSDDEDGSDADSGAENDAAIESANPRERKKETSGRDHELIHTARMKQQGIRMEDEEEEEDDGDEGKESDFAAKPAAGRAGGAAAAADGSAMDESEGGSGGGTELTHYQKMKALFDKKKDDKYMTFDADDPLKPNPNKKRAAEREDEELDEDAAKDPWLRQAAEDSARAAESGASGGGSDIASHFSTHNGKKATMVSSTAVFDNDDAAPVFDQHKARMTLLAHMRPGETVMKAVKRLGSSGAGAAGSAGAAPQKITKMKNVRSKPKEGTASAATPAVTPADAAAEKQRKAAFEAVTEAAQGFIGAAYLEIYQDTYEKLDRLVQVQRAHQAQVEQRKAAAAAAAAGGAAAGASAAPSAGADARARAAARLQRKRDARAAGLPEPDSSDDEDDDVSAARPAAAASAASSAAASSPAAAAAAPLAPSVAADLDESDGVQWIYKWSPDESEINGPYPSSKMAEWKKAGFFGADVIVQRLAPGAVLPDAEQANKIAWINVAQIDFARPHITNPMPAPSASTTAAGAAAAGGPAKKKFKF